MKVYHYLSLWLILSNVIKLINCDAKEAHRKRNFETIVLFLSKFQENFIESKILYYSFYSIKFTKINFFPAITTDMKIEPRKNIDNHVLVSNYIATFYCNVTIHIRDSTKVINENDFIIEMNITDSAFVTGKTLSHPMKFLSLFSFLVSYSDNRNFLVSKRFYSEFEHDNQTKGQFNKMIYDTFLSNIKLLNDYNYQQVDFRNINQMLTNYKKTINRQINSTLVLESYIYTTLVIPDSKIIEGKIDCGLYNAYISYVLEDKTKTDKFHKTLRMSLPLFQFAYDNIEFNNPVFDSDNVIKEVNEALFQEFKINFRSKAQTYYDTFKDDK